MAPPLLKKLTASELCWICEEDLDYSVDSVYLFTLNCSKKLCSDATPHRLKWETMIVLILKKFHRCMKYYCVMPEISLQGRLHCHGWFVIKDNIKWQRGVLPTMKSYAPYGVKITKLKNVNGFKYYKKDILDTQEILSGVTLPLCHYNLDDILLAYCLKHMSKVVKGNPHYNILQYFKEN